MRARMAGAGARVRLLTILAVLIFAGGAAGHAAELVLNPDPLPRMLCEVGDCGGSDVPRLLDIGLVSGSVDENRTEIELWFRVRSDPSLLDSQQSFVVAFDSDVFFWGANGSFAVRSAWQSRGGDPRRPSFGFRCHSTPCSATWGFLFDVAPSRVSISSTSGFFADHPDGTSQTVSGVFVVVPEPSTAALVALGLAVMSTKGCEFEASMMDTTARPSRRRKRDAVG